MSEAVSAFAAYKINSSKYVGKGKKGNAAGSKSGGTAKGNAKAKGAAAGAKGKNGTTAAKAKGAAAKAKGAKGVAGKDKPAKGAAANKAAAAKSTAKATTADSKPAAKNSKAAGAKPAAKNGKAAGAKPAANKNGKAGAGAAKGKKSNGIHSSEVDQLVEQLLGDSTSKTKKLSKEDQKKKQELEDYLVRQLEKDDGKYGSEDSDEEDDYSTGSESGSDEFSDEFTLNSTGSFTNCSGEEEESYETDSGSETESASTDSEDMQDNKEPKVGARKRKSNEGAGTQKKQDTAAVNGNTTAKKSKQAAEAKPSSSRKSLPAVKVKPAEIKRRSVGANSTTIEATTISSTRNLGNIALKLEPVSPPANIIKMNSIKEGEKMFQWVLNPVTIKDFFAKYWERSACLVKREHASYYAKLISFEAIDQMLLKNHVEFTKNIDITSYKNGVRETLNPEGRAMPPIVWDHYGQGCSIRLLNPHTFLPELCTMNTTLQEYFHCMVGTNAYLTPPNSQGFAPHYDDIEAFVLQIEGRKRWKLYSPRTLAENLPRFSSPNFSQQDIGKPILEVVLEPGDVLYFPRGTIHQASTEPGYHSLHITLSVYQKQSYADLFERLIPLMLQRTIANNVDMRRGLPLHTWRNAGIAFSDSDTKERADLVQKVSQLLNNCLRSAPVAELMDAAVDQVAKKFQHEALPPEILSAERVRTVFGSRSRTNERGECVCDYEIGVRTNVRLLRANIMRLVSEEDKIRIYYYLDNSKEYCEYEPNFMEVDPEQAGSVEVLIKSYPAYVGVSQLPLPSDELKIELATALWERGLLMMERPFK